MSRPIEQALSNLIPRHPGPLPPELIELASSLLQQSRTTAGSLKPDEEIARTYACANIACERLKTTLNLPPIEPRPPVPPRVYSKLYTYLDKLLVSSRRRATSKPQSSHNTPVKASSSKQRSTPSKEKSLAGFRTPVKNGKENEKIVNNRTPKRGLKYVGNKEREERIPRWVAPVVRFLCREMGTKTVVPHVLAGVESVLCLPSPGHPDDDNNSAQMKMEGKIPALLGAIWLFVYQEFNGEMGPKEFGEKRRMALKVLSGAGDDLVVRAKVGDEEEGWREWESVALADMDRWVKEISGKGWLDLDWFANIGDSAITADEENEEDSESQGENKRRKTVGVEGFGVTMRDRYDYLSKENRDEYREWKEKILSAIEDLVDDGVTEMDTMEG